MSTLALLRDSRQSFPSTSISSCAITKGFLNRSILAKSNRRDADGNKIEAVTHAEGHKPLSRGLNEAFLG